MSMMGSLSCASADAVTTQNRPSQRRDPASFTPKSGFGLIRLSNERLAFRARCGLAIEALVLSSVRFSKRFHAARDSQRSVV
jgi:hypothetical protein